MSKSLRGATTSGNKGCCSSKSLKNLEATGVAGVGAQSLSQFISQSQTGDIIIDGGGGGGIGQIPDPLTVNNLIVLELAALENALIGTQLNIGNGDLVFQNNTITSNGSILVFPTIDFQIDPNLVVNGDYTRLNTTETRIFDRVPVIGFVDPGGILALDNHDRGLEFDYVTTDGMSFFFNRGFFGYDKDRDRFVAWKRAIIDGGAFGSDQNYMRTGAELNEFDLDVIYTTEIRNVDYLIGGSPNLNIRIMAASDIIFRSLLEDHLTADVEYVVTDEEIHTVGIGGASNTGRFRVEVANNPDCNRIELNDKVLVGVDPGVFIYHDELIEIKTCEAMSLIDIASADDMMITAENTLGVESLSGAITLDADSGIFERNRSGQFLVSSGTATTGGFTQIRGRKAATPLPGNFVPANGDVYIEATDEIFLDANDPITLFSGDYVKVVPILRVDEITSCNTTDPVTFDTDICITAGNALLTNEIHEKDSNLTISTTGGGFDILLSSVDRIVSSSTGNTIITTAGAAASTGIGTFVYMGGAGSTVIRAGNAPPGIPGATDPESVFIGAEAQTVILAGSPTIPASFGVGSDLLVCAADNLILCADAASGILVESDLCVTAGNRILTDTINEKSTDLTIATVGAGNNINIVAGGTGDINLTATGDNIISNSDIFDAVSTGFSRLLNNNNQVISYGSGAFLFSQPGGVGEASLVWESAGETTITCDNSIRLTAGLYSFPLAGTDSILMQASTSPISLGSMSQSIAILGGGVTLADVPGAFGTNDVLICSGNDVFICSNPAGPGTGSIFLDTDSAGAVNIAGKLNAISASNNVTADRLKFATVSLLNPAAATNVGAVMWYNGVPGFTLTAPPGAGSTFLRHLAGTVSWASPPAVSLQVAYDNSIPAVINLSDANDGIIIKDSQAFATFSNPTAVDGPLFQVGDSSGGPRNYFKIEKTAASTVGVNIGESTGTTPIALDVFSTSILMRTTTGDIAMRAGSGAPTIAAVPPDILMSAADDVFIMVGASAVQPFIAGKDFQVSAEDNVALMAGTSVSVTNNGTIDESILLLANSTLTTNASRTMDYNIAILADSTITYAGSDSLAFGNIVIAAGATGQTIDCNIDDNVLIMAGSISPILIGGSNDNNVQILAEEEVYIRSDGGQITLDATKTTITGLLDPTGLLLSGQLTAPATPSSGDGLIWVKSTVASTLQYRISSTDYVIPVTTNPAVNAGSIALPQTTYIYNTPGAFAGSLPSSSTVPVGTTFTFIITHATGSFGIIPSGGDTFFANSATGVNGATNSPGVLTIIRIAGGSGEDWIGFKNQ